MTGIVNEVSDAVIGLVPIVLVGGTPEVTEACLTMWVGGWFVSFALWILTSNPARARLARHFCISRPSASSKVVSLT